MNDLESFKDRIQPENKYIIYGAQHHAHCMYLTLKQLLPDAEVLYFMVTEKQDDPDSIEGVAVKNIWECTEQDREIVVLVAVSLKHLDNIRATLAKWNYSNVFDGTFGGDFDNDVRARYFTDCKALREIKGGMPHKTLSLCMYMAKSVVDQKLHNEPDMPEYIRPVQAGAALTEERIADCRDDAGENISLKNRNYCECTVTYYIWKHATEDYVGLCHYRRRFRFNEKDLEILRGGEVDVVLPNPVITVKGRYDVHYKPYVEEGVYETMLSVLKEAYPDYYETALKVMQGDQFYPCNVVLAKKVVFDAYAEWMFDVLARVEAVCGDETVRTDRYLGYLAEHLTTFYFVKNRNRLNIAHSMMEILK